MLYRKAPPQPPQFLLRAVVAGTAAFLGMRVMACGGAVEPTGPEGTTSGASGSYTGMGSGSAVGSGSSGTYTGVGSVSTGYTGSGTGSTGYTGSGTGSTGYIGTGSGSTGYTGSGSGTAGFTGSGSGTCFGFCGVVVSGAYGGDAGTSGSGDYDSSVGPTRDGGGFADATSPRDAEHVDSAAPDTGPEIVVDACACEPPDAAEAGIVCVCDALLQKEIAPIEFDKVVGEP